MTTRQELQPRHDPPDDASTSTCTNNNGDVEMSKSAATSTSPHQYRDPHQDGVFRHRHRGVGRHLRIGFSLISLVFISFRNLKMLGVPVVYDDKDVIHHSIILTNTARTVASAGISTSTAPPSPRPTQQPTATPTKPPTNPQTTLRTQPPTMATRLDKRAPVHQPTPHANPWFQGVFDSLSPLKYVDDDSNELKEICTISSNLRDIEDGNNHTESNIEDSIEATLRYFSRSPNAKKTKFFGGVTGQEFGFPCTIENVRVAYTEPLDFNWTQQWKNLTDEMNVTDKAKEERNTSQVIYACVGKGGNTNLRTMTLGIDPKRSKDQIKTSKAHYAKMNYKNNTGPPDLIMIVMDTTSRASFHRSFPSIVDSLRNKKWPVDVFEMFRYSTLTRSTMPNMQILLQGCGGSPLDKPKKILKRCEERDVPLHLWYATAGYVLLGDYPYIHEINNGADEIQAAQYGEVFSASPKMDSRFIKGKYGRLQMDVYVDLFLEQSAFYAHHAPELPQYFVAHMDDNHGDVNDGLKGQATSLHRLLDGINFSGRNAMVVFIGDHGKYGGSRFATPLGDVEKSNPVLLAAVSHGALTPEHSSMWNKNQQHLVTHWDMHATLKSLPLQYGTGWPDVESYCRLNGQGGASTCGTGLNYSSSWYHANDLHRSGCTAPWQYNLLQSLVAKNRTCSDAMSQSNFCMCAGVASEGRKWTAEENLRILNQTAMELNTWTGNGFFDCRIHHAEDFVISRTLSYQLQNRNDKLYGHHLLTINSKSTKASFMVEINETMQVEYITNQYGLFAPNMIRQDRFDEEQCLITFQEGFMPIFKSNKTPGGNLMLRWCSCKPSNPINVSSSVLLQGTSRKNKTRRL